MYIFWKKNCKNRLRVEGSAHERPLASGACGLRVATPAYYYNPVDFVSSAKFVFSLKKEENN